MRESHINSSVQILHTSIHISGSSNALNQTPLHRIDNLQHCSNMSQICSVCHHSPAEGAAIKRCSKCKATYYCSTDCQRVDFKSHKWRCLPLALDNRYASVEATGTIKGVRLPCPKEGWTNMIHSHDIPSDHPIYNNP